MSCARLVLGQALFLAVLVELLAPAGAEIFSSSGDRISQPAMSAPHFWASAR